MSASASDYRNALIHETSPYLLQHAHNPVNWYPWSAETLALAKEQQKPILLSIGYSACHWCHVMAHESFEDAEIAAIMNQLFINIKVDREERPDLDKIYQLAHQMLTRRNGGWPLTMFLTPDDQFPFFGGTYFPPTPRHGLPAFPDLLQKIAMYYVEHQDEITEQNQRLDEALQSIENPPISGREVLTDVPLTQAIEQLKQSFDSEHGGFGSAPKFPHLTNLELLLRYALFMHHKNPTEEEAEVLQILNTSLEKMAMGGIYDQLGGGFYRYSVDEFWMIPHFEKMLYDNGPFLSIYSQAWQYTQAPLYERVARETADWTLREMHSPEGGFYSTLDADSEGEEGKFYAWDRMEIKELLGEQRYKPFAIHFGIKNPPNFEGKWHLHVFHPRAKVAEKCQMALQTVDTELDAARQILFKARTTRVYPGRDEKILTAWNGLMISGLATTGLILNEPRYIQAATQALDFIRDKLWVDGQLRAAYKDGRARFNAYLDDYAFLLEAILNVLQAQWRSQDLQFAIALADSLLNDFQDEDNGGFFFTAHEHEQLITRSKPFGDDAIPAGNGVAVLALMRLGHLLGEPRYLEAAEQTLQAAWESITYMPYAHCSLLLGFIENLNPMQTLILRGEPAALQAWQQLWRQQARPHQLCFAIPTEASDLPPLLAARQPQGECVAYICEGQSCSPPMADMAAFEAWLHANTQ